MKCGLGSLYPGETRQWAIGRKEAEWQYGEVSVIVLSSKSRKSAQLRHERDRHEQITASSSNLEVEVGHGRFAAVDDRRRRRRKFELDAGERELESDASVVDGALALDRQRRRRHRHAHVHRGETVKLCRRHRRRRLTLGTSAFSVHLVALSTNTLCQFARCTAS